MSFTHEVDADPLDVYAVVTQGSTGEIIADGGMVRLWGGSAVTGGTLKRTGDAVIVGYGTVTLTDVTVAPGGYYGVNGGQTTWVGGAALVNEGEIRINHGAACAGTALTLNSSLTVSGSGEIVFNGASGCGTGTAVLNASSGITLTQAAGHTIHGGTARIDAPLVNDGLVCADRSGEMLELYAGAKTNHAQFTATSGGFLDVYTSVTQGSAGELVADGGTVRLLGGSTVVGGTLRCTGSSTILGYGSTTLTNVTFAPGAYYAIKGGQTTTVGGSLVNDGEIHVNYEAACNGTALTLSNSLTVNGSGEILLTGYPGCGTGTAVLNAYPGVMLTQPASHTVHGGSARIDAALVNDGLVCADRAGEVLELYSNSKTNNAQFKAIGGAYLDVYTSIAQGSGGEIVADGGNVRLFNGAAVSGGTLRGTGDSTFSGLGSVTLTDVTLTPGTDYSINAGTTTTLAGSVLTNDGQVRVNPQAGCAGTGLVLGNSLSIGGTGEVLLTGAPGCGPGTAQLGAASGVTLTHGAGHTVRGRTAQISGAMLNHGHIVADGAGEWLHLYPGAPGMVSDGTLEVAAGSNLALYTATLFSQTGGELVVAGQLQVNSGPLDLQGGALRGSGTVTGSISNTGATVEPGNSAGILTVTSNYTQAADGALAIELGGADPGTGFDRLAVHGSATLAGELNVTAIDGFEPTLGQQFVILTAGTISGQFTSLTGAVNYRVVYSPHDVTIVIVTPPCVGDLNCDGQISFGDINLFVLYLSNFANWLAAYPVCNPRNGDINGDGVYGQSSFADINPFVALMTQCGSGCTCSGPGRP